MIKLYSYGPSSNSRKVRAVLVEKGLEFSRVNIDLSKKEQKSPEYLKIHPFGQVPALDDEGFILYDSTIINEYLEDEYPYPSLMPKDSEGRAQARLDGRFARQSLQSRGRPAESGITQTGRRKRSKERSSKPELKLLNASSASKKNSRVSEYLAGDFSLADIAFYANIDTLDRIQVQVDAKYKNVLAWIARLKARPSFAASAS